MQTHSDDECLGLHGVSSVSTTALAHDLYNLEITSQDGGEEASSQATTGGDHPTKRPPGVKAAKGVGGKRVVGDPLGVSGFEGM
ncbi:hypothetical protein F2Q70_00039514 [Brassica cretica]|uniref:Uncharacterized protein n=1 Tax=Brassica cretica TaxID=69181 RepID=A0A8S9K8G0_BRACR|nr:hypothetical protein F2Q70_00039514 [Brassica cretica]